MESQQHDRHTYSREILFPNGNRAQLLIPLNGTSTADILRAIGIQQPRALVIVIGGANGFNKNQVARLTQLFSRGVARAAVDMHAVIIDGGTNTGVMALIGQGVADRGYKTPLLGVVPTGKVSYPDNSEEGDTSDNIALDPNHSHFVQVESLVWSGETTKAMFALAAALANCELASSSIDARDQSTSEELNRTIPVVTILAGGRIQGVARDELLQSVRHGWPIVVIKGSGKLADEIVRLLRKKQRIKARQGPERSKILRALARLLRPKPLFINDSTLAEIIEDGTIQVFPLDGTVPDLHRLLIRQLKKKRTETILDVAWKRFALYDSNADRQQNRFKFLRHWTLVLGVISTFTALTYTVLKIFVPFYERSWSGLLLRLFILTVPIVTSILLTTETRFNAGSKWVLLRSSAEAIKREIFRYRALPDYYIRSDNSNDQSVEQLSREALFAQQIADISRRVMQTDVNETALRPYTGPIPPNVYGTDAVDDGFTALLPDRYVALRLSDQLAYYQRKTAQLEKQLRRFQLWILLYGGAGTFLAAVEAELWIPLTTAVVTALATYLEYQQVEQTLKKFNLIETDLSNVYTWWMALSADEKRDPNNINKLVDYTEFTLEGEHSGWVQQMQETLAGLHDRRDGGEHNAIPMRIK